MKIIQADFNTTLTIKHPNQKVDKEEYVTKELDWLTRGDVIIIMYAHELNDKILKELRPDLFKKEKE